MMPKSKTIDEMSVTCVSLDPWEGYALLPDLASVMAPLLSAKQGEIDLEIALRNAASSLSKERLPEMLVRLLRGTIVVVASETGTVKYEITDRATFSLAFGGPRFWSAIKVAAFAFEVTYGNFSDVIGRFTKAMPTQ